MRAILSGVPILALSLIDVAVAQGTSAPELKPVGPPYVVTDDLAGESQLNPEGVSGIACLPSSAAPRRCLVVIDERRKAQFVTIENNRMTPGEEVGLIGKAPSEAALGQKPSVATCPGRAGPFGELDGEGVAYAAPYFYVVGSHGCTRRTGTFKLSLFNLTRIRVDAAGKPSGDAETTYRLSDALRLEPTVGPFFGKRLMTPDGSGDEPNGLNVEGLAVIGDRLFVGLRAPSKDGNAYVLSASLADLFAAGRAPSQAVPELIPLALGEHVGIRDLAPLPNGRLLALVGPAQEQTGVPYRLVVVEPRQSGERKEVGVLPDLSPKGREGKAEAVAVLAPDRVLILFDRLPNGGPREYALPSPLY